MTKKMWGGRFKNKIHPLVEEFSRSIAFDQRLAKYDCLGSIAHATMLGKCKIIPETDAAKIVEALNEILDQINKNKFVVSQAAEDIHTCIQNALEEKIGKIALKLHTARSRNDQVSLDTRMFVKDAITGTIKLIGKFQDTVSALVKHNHDLIMVGYTHLQHAQPVLLKDYLFAYIEMTNRDKERLTEIFKRCDSLPLGSCALAGTTLPIDRGYVAKILGFSRVSTSTLDAVSDRDFVIELLNALAIIGMHLSRLAEDFIIFSTAEFGFIEIGDGFCTGSSLMPQKKNPDVLELTRGFAARLLGNYISVMTLMKGLPLTYNRDMQLDKEPLFNSIDIVQETLKVLTELMKDIKFNKHNIAKQVKDEFILATDLAEFLVKKGVPFQEAHEIIGKIVGFSIQENKQIKSMSNEELAKFTDKLNIDEAREILEPEKSTKARR